MKKIILIFITVLLPSCSIIGNNQDDSLYNKTESTLITKIKKLYLIPDNRDQINDIENNVDDILVKYYSDKSFENEDISLCDNLNDINKDSCIFNYYISIAIKTKDISFCDNLNNNSIECKEMVGNIIINLNNDDNKTKDIILDNTDIVDLGDNFNMSE